MDSQLGWSEAHTVMETAPNGGCKQSGVVTPDWVDGDDTDTVHSSVDFTLPYTPLPMGGKG